MHINGALIFVALWFILRGDLFLCLSLCYFVLVFLSPFSIAITSLGEERANLSAFRTFVRFALVWFCLFPLPFGVWEGLRFVIVALPGLFSLTVFFFFFFLHYFCTLSLSRCFRKFVAFLANAIYIVTDKVFAVFEKIRYIW